MGKNKKNKNKKKHNKKTNPQVETDKQDPPDVDSAQEGDGDAETISNITSSNTLKRDFPDDDSDTEEKPRKKKKKKPVPVEGEKKGKKSIRQMKRDKHAQRQADAQAVAKDELKSQCLTYLSQWKHNKQHWKFMKAKQVWLYKNKFSPSLVPNETWPVFLEYFESAQGNIKSMLLTDANNIIKQMDEWTEKNSQKPDSNENEEEEADLTKPDETAYKRARDLIQCLQE